MNENEKLMSKLGQLEDQLKQLNKALDLQRHFPSTPLKLKELAVADSAQYIYENFPYVSVFKVRQDTLRFALEKADQQGVFLEFGVNAGQTINQIGKQRKDAKVFGFDSFEGLPEDWGGTGQVKGTFHQHGHLPAVPRNVTLIKGWFDQSVPKWKAKNKENIAFCHVDCDLYSSTITVFEELEDRFQDGTILVFDEYFGYADWRNGEHKAFIEMIERTGFEYEPLAVSHMAFVCRLKRG